MAKQRYTKRAPKKKKSRSIEIVARCDYCGKLFPIVREGIDNPETNQPFRHTYGRNNWSALRARAEGLSALVPGDHRNSRPTDKVLIFCNDKCMEAAA